MHWELWPYVLAGIIFVVVVLLAIHDTKKDNKKKQ